MPDQTEKTKSAFGFDAPEESPGFLLWQTTITWQRLIKKALESYDIPHAGFVIMAILLFFEERKQNFTQIGLAKLSKLDKMTVSQTLKKLESKGYTKRHENEKDPRAKTVQLTEEGRKLTTTLVPLIENIDHHFFKTLNPIDQSTLIRILNELNAGSS